jgi:hypothetical protein
MASILEIAAGSSFAEPHGPEQLARGLLLGALGRAERPLTHRRGVVGLLLRGLQPPVGLLLQVVDLLLVGLDRVLDRGDAAVGVLEVRLVHLAADAAGCGHQDERQHTHECQGPSIAHRFASSVAGNKTHRTGLL